MMDFIVASLIHIFAGLISGVILDKFMIRLVKKYNMNRFWVVSIQIFLSIIILYYFEVKVPYFRETFQNYVTPSILLTTFFLGSQTNIRDVLTPVFKLQ